MARTLLALPLIAALLCSVARAQPPVPSAAAHYRLDPHLPTLWIIGASAVRNGHDTGNDGQWGWGNPIAAFFDRSRINVVNYASAARARAPTGRWGCGAMRWPT